MGIQHISSLSDFNAAVAKAGSNLVVIDFHATWCGPCHAIAPFYESLSSNPKYRAVSFLKCDVDQAREVASKFSVSAMPTFVFCRSGSAVKTVRGANKSAIQSTLDELVSGSGGGSHQWGSGQTLGSGTSQTAPSTGLQIPSLQQAMDKAQSLDPNVKIGLALAAVYLWWIFT